jgi:hypothetical protein
LTEEIAGRSQDDRVKLEIELVYRSGDQVGIARENEVLTAVLAWGGRLISRCRIDSIAYHAILAELPVHAVRAIIDRNPTSIVSLDPVMHIRPQSIASSIDIADADDAGSTPGARTLAEPILALLDGVPIAAHPLLAEHLVVDDQFGLEPESPVANRVHGTAMASLIVHGDRNRAEAPLPRRVHVVPVMGAQDCFPDDRLIVDIIFRAVVAMREGANATAPHVLIVNLSLGNARRPFHGQISAWARLIDRLSYQYGILFIVSAGNCTDPFPITAYANSIQFEDAPSAHRSAETLRAVAALVADRRLFSPAETVNGITVGAANIDAVPVADRVVARSIVNPYLEQRMANPSSALGPGFARSVKPDILMPGAREHLRMVSSNPHIEVRPSGPARSAGLKVAGPPQAGRENVESYTNGTSGAAALASRTCHRIHDALEAAYGADFVRLPHVQRAVLIKALLAHPASWPDEAATLIRTTIGPPEGKYHTRQKDNIRRFLGFGIVDADDAVACAADRATFWATGTLEANKVCNIDVPLPVAMGGRASSHSLSATLAWFTPISPGRRSYRAVRLKLLEPDGLADLSVSAHSNQPDGNQTNRGTLFNRCWTGDSAAVISPSMSIKLTVQRDPDQGEAIDEAIPFGFAVTLAMPGAIQIYEQVRQRLAIVPRAPA